MADVMERQTAWVKGERVLQVVTDDDRRGAQVFAVDLQSALAGRGWCVRTVALAHGTTGGLGVDALGPTRLHLRALRRLRRLVRTADVVVGHGSTTLPACGIATLGTGVPFVYRQISDSLFWANTAARRLRVRTAMRRPNRVVALWHGAADVLVEQFGVARTRIDRVPNGVPLAQFCVSDTDDARRARESLGLAGDTRLVVYVGALVPEKGVDTAIDALADLPGAVLLVVGDGPERATLKHRARVYGGRVRFAGSLDDVHPVLAAADVVVLPSRGGDSMPAVLIEAGLTGVPVVSTPVAAIPEIVVDGTTGYIVAPDDAGALAAAVSKILSDAALRSTFGRAAREHCAVRFSIDVVAEQWDRTLRRSIHGRPARDRRGDAV